MSLICADCGESLANVFCRCACQREPQPKDERIAELEASLADAHHWRLHWKEESTQAKAQVEALRERIRSYKRHIVNLTALLDE